MNLKIWELVSIMLSAIVGGMYWGPWLALTKSLKTFKPDVFLDVVNRLNRNMAPLMTVLSPIALLSIIPVLFLSFNKYPITFYFDLAGFVLFVVALLVTTLIEVPIVKRITTWTVPTLPDNWTQLRDRWGLFHIIRVIAGIVGLALLVAGAIFFFHSSIPQASSGASDTTNLPDIPAPAGWQAERQDFSRITFVKDGEAVGPDRIDVDALKEHGTLDQEIARDDDNIPSGSATATSTAYIGWNGVLMDYLNGNRVPIGWAVINGNLILVANDRQADAGTSIDYMIFNNGVIYMFSTAYQQYDLAQKQFVTAKNTDGLQTIQKMVQEFAQSLPAETYPQ